MLHRINVKEFEVSLVQSFPKPLSAKEEKECIEKCRSGDRGARDCLIERNLRLVAYIAKKYNMGDKDMDDLISIGTIGLIKGIDSFDETKNIRLATYAARCIEKPIQYIGCITCCSPCLSFLSAYVSKTCPPIISSTFLQIVSLLFL